MRREDIYIDLSVFAGDEIPEKPSNSDRIMLNMQHQSHLKKQGIALHELVLAEDTIVAMRGVAGIGKSSVIEMYTLEWAKGELDVPLEIDFIFSFTCREINCYLDRISSIEELFKVKYADVFSAISLESLRPIGDRILVIIDGVDEIHNVYKIEEAQQSEHTHCHLRLVSDLLNIKGDFLPNHKVVYSGRPKACHFIKSRYIENTKIKTIEVCGFNQKSIIAYIDQFFEADDTGKAEIVKGTIKKSSNLSAMASVPVFLWIICNVHNENLVTEQLISTTELYFYTCIIFIRNHLREKGIPQGNWTLAEIVNDESVIDCIYCLMELASKSYFEDQVLFKEDEIKSLPKGLHLEQTGFIVKYERRQFDSRMMFQFSHLVLQEFLSSLYIYITQRFTNSLLVTEMESCMPTFLEITKMIQTKENELFCQFVDRIGELYQREIMSTLGSISSHLCGEISFHAFIDEKTKVPDCMLNENGFYLDTRCTKCREFLALWYEVKFDIKEPGYYAEIRYVTLSVDRRNITSFLDHLNIKTLKISDYYPLPYNFRHFLIGRELFFDIDRTKLPTINVGEDALVDVGRIVSNYENITSSISAQRFIKSITGVLELNLIKSCQIKRIIGKGRLSLIFFECKSTLVLITRDITSAVHDCRNFECVENYISSKYSSTILYHFRSNKMEPIFIFSLSPTCDQPNMYDMVEELKVAEVEVAEICRFSNVFFRLSEILNFSTLTLIRVNGKTLSDELVDNLVFFSSISSTSWWVRYLLFKNRFGASLSNVGAQIANTVHIQAEDILKLEYDLQSEDFILADALSKVKYVVVSGSFASDQVPTLVSILQLLRVEKVSIVQGDDLYAYELVDIADVIDDPDELLCLLVTVGKLNVKSCFSSHGNFSQIESIRDILTSDQLL